MDATHIVSIEEPLGSGYEDIGSASSPGSSDDEVAAESKFRLLKGSCWCGGAA